MTKEEFFKKAKELKDKAAEKTRPAREKVKTKLGNVVDWCSEHKGTIVGTAIGALVIHTRGYWKGHEDGRIHEHVNLERRYDTALKLALKKEGMTEEEADILGAVQEMVDDFGGLDEVRCLFEDDFEGWCKLRDLKEDEED